MDDIRADWGLRPVVNVSGTMTFLGASIVVPEAVEAMRRILPQFVEIGDLQRRASRTIAALTGAEAGMLTASCAAGISVAVAAAMTGHDLAAVERLPDTAGLRDEVVLQTGQLVSYGASIEQAVRLTGARTVLVGQATSAYRYQLEAAISQRTAAVLYVVTHHAVLHGLIDLVEVVEVAHAKGVPVIVDAASEYDLKGFLAQGADIVLYSAHKFLGGPTAGIVAGSKALVRAAYLQNSGIARGMKLGKESMAGAIAAMEAWQMRDHAAVRAKETGYLRLWQDALAGRPGITATIDPDPTHNPLDRLKVSVEPEAAHITAWDLADALAAGDPPVIVRDHEAELGFFFLDPCNLHPGQERIVTGRLIAELDRARASNEVIRTPLQARRNRRAAGLLRWPD